MVTRMAVLLWSYYTSSVLLSVWHSCLHQSWAKRWMRTPGCRPRWASSARFWNMCRASHTWMDSLTLRLCVCLISFLNWGLVYGAFAEMNKARQFKSLLLRWNLSFGHRSPVRRKCFTGFFREKRRGSSVLPWSWRRLTLLGSWLLLPLRCLC